MLSSSRDALLKTTSPEKIFPSDCITLYNKVARFVRVSIRIIAIKAHQRIRISLQLLKQVG